MSQGVDVQCVSTDGTTWLVHRDMSVNGDRDNDASTDEKYESIEVCGVLWNIGGGPWLLTTPGKPIMGVDVPYTAIHWATRITALERLWKNKVHIKSKAVQIGVSGGLHHCTIYTQNAKACKIEACEPWQQQE